MKIIITIALFFLTVISNVCFAKNDDGNTFLKEQKDTPSFEEYLIDSSPDLLKYYQSQYLPFLFNSEKLVDPATNKPFSRSSLSGYFDIAWGNFFQNYYSLMLINFNYNKKQKVDLYSERDITENIKHLDVNLSANYKDYAKLCRYQLSKFKEYPIYSKLTGECVFFHLYQNMEKITYFYSMQGVSIDKFYKIISQQEKQAKIAFFQKNDWIKK